jgi:hypothetical protein
MGKHRYKGFQVTACGVNGNDTILRAVMTLRTEPVRETRGPHGNLNGG